MDKNVFQPDEIKNKPPIVIYLCTDNNYAVPTYIALFSLLQNHHDRRIVHAYILTTKDFSEKNTKMLKYLLEKHNCLKLRIISMKNCFQSATISMSRLSVATMYRLMIPYITDQMEGRNAICVYLDSDIVVEGDIAELIDLNIDGYYIGGVIDKDILCETDEELRRHYEELQLSFQNPYINAGILLINTKIIKEFGIDHKLIEYGRNSCYTYNDQDIINSVCFDRIRIIPDKYNVMVSSYYHSSKKYKADDIKLMNETKRNPFIIHYNSARKPWMFKGMLMSGKWWKYVEMQDNTFYCEYIKPFLKNNRASFNDRVLETIKTIMINIGAYQVLRKPYELIRY